MADDKLIKLRNKWMTEAGKKIPSSKMPTVVQFLNMMCNGDVSSPYATTTKAKAKPKKKAAAKKKASPKKKK